MPFYAAVICGGVVLPLIFRFEWTLVVIAAANVFFVVYLVLTAIRLPHLTAAFLKKHAAETDEPGAVILMVISGTILVVAGSLVILFMVINGKGAPDTASLVLALSLVSVWLGWLTIHTMAALHYAHRYWEPDDAAGSSQHGKGEPRRGLQFPRTPEPQGIDFLYFAFVLGMTAQTADVQINTTAMRKLSLPHAMASFFFNTVLVAAAVNLAVSLAG